MEATVGFEWRFHDDTHRRVWRTDWEGDQFEILDEEEFRAFLKFARRFSFYVQEAEE